jgi:hypothetical protein
MAGKIKIAFENLSTRFIPLVVFEITKDENGNKTSKAVYIGGVPGSAFSIIELDNTFQPWAIIDTKGYKLGDAFKGDFGSLIQLEETHGGSAYRIDQWL